MSAESDWTDATTALTTHGLAYRAIVLEDDNTEWEIVAVDGHGDCAIEFHGMAAVFVRVGGGDRGAIRRVDEGQAFDAGGKRYVVVMTNGSGNLGWEEIDRE
jgi:hypothetical protein